MDIANGSTIERNMMIIESLFNSTIEIRIDPKSLAIIKFYFEFETKKNHHKL